ncbi:hypothetical protein ABC345_20995 [Shouchella sp. 1P09AA]|uniref:hypothetical protein n=1 Tax=unclassified Shouchella TaxID=2893065 RepID=UPI0039A09047
MAILKGNKGSFKRKCQPRGSAVFIQDNETSPKRPKDKKPRIKSSFADIAPTIDLTANGYCELSNGDGFMEVIQLTSTDIYALNEADKQKKIFSFAYFIQWYSHDWKVIPFDFPVDTSRQQRFVIQKMQEASKPQYRAFLEKKLEELQFIERERYNREFYMFLYADDEFTLRDRVANVTAKISRVAPAIQLSEEKKINILYKLHNLNSKNRTAKGES